MLNKIKYREKTCNDDYLQSVYLHTNKTCEMDNVINEANPQNWLGLYGDLMYQYCLPRVNDNIIAEDLVQETFLSALKGLDGFKGEASEKNWLFAILKNKIIDHYRKKAKELTVISNADPVIEDDSWFNDEGRWVDNKRPRDWTVKESPAEQKEIQKIINLCKDALKTVQQQVFILKYMEDMESDDICKVLNITPSNYWVLLHRARLQMRDCVEKNWIKN